MMGTAAASTLGSHLGPLSKCLAPAGTTNNAQARPLGAASRAALDPSGGDHAGRGGGRALQATASSVAA